MKEESTSGPWEPLGVIGYTTREFEDGQWVREDVHVALVEQYEGLVEQLETAHTALRGLTSGLKYLSREQIMETDAAATAILDVPCGYVQDAIRVLETATNSPRAGDLLWMSLQEGQQPPPGWTKDGDRAWRVADGTEHVPESSQR